MAGHPTPQLDSRNQSFLSPAKVQALPPPRVPNLGSHPTEDNMPLTKSDPNRSPQLRPQNHARTSSFFASFRGKDKNPPPADHHTPQQPTSHPEGPSSSRPSSEMRGPPPTQPPPQPPTQPPSQQAQPAPANDGSNLHPEIRSIVQLTVAHAHKVYFSGPLVKRIERQPDGQKPHKDEGWVNVWAQLGGTTLSIWDMKAVQEASKRGEEVPPAYVNMTDAFVQVLGSVTVPGHGDAPPQKYTNVLTLNTAGSNLLLFSCPSSEALMSWAAALRLSSWEKSRLEEIYTAHIIRITLNNRAIPTTLSKGKLEGWARIRVAGQTDWKQVWLVVTAASNPSDPHSAANGNGKKNRMSQLFSREGNEGHAGGPLKSTVTVFVSQKPKDRKTAVLTLHDVTQAFAVYPERPELITRSSLIKIEGQFGNEEAAGAMASREGWLLVMPMLEGTTNPSSEMLKWLIALHDAFGLYGRPREWTWDPRDPRSMMFAYPVGPQKEQLFLERESAERLDPRDDRTSAIRSGLLNLLVDAMRNGQHGPVQPPSQNGASSSALPAQREPPPRLPPIGEDSPILSGPQIPPLNFEIDANRDERAGLSPIKEASVSTSRYSTIEQHAEPPQDNALRPIIGRELTTSPIPASPSPGLDESVANPPTTMNGRATYEPNRQATTIRHTMIPASSDLAAAAAGSSSQGPASPRSSPVQASQHTRQETSHSMMMSARRASLSPPTSPPTIPLPKSPEEPSISQSSEHPSLAPSSPRASFMTSPYSMMDNRSTGGDSYKQAQTPPTPLSALASPHSPIEPPQGNFPSLSEFGGAQRKDSQGNASSFMTEARSLKSNDEPQGYDGANGMYMRQQREMEGTRPLSPRQKAQSPTPSSPKSSYSIPSVPSRRMTVEQKEPEPVVSMRPGIGRRPSGARAAPANRIHNVDERLSSPLTEEESDTSSFRQTIVQRAMPPQEESAEHLDALAVLSYLDINSDQPANAPAPRNVTRQQEPPPPNPQILEPSTTSTPSSSEAGQFRSSFAPSKQASERKAKAQAQQAAHQAAVHKPGRAGNGAPKPKAAKQGWAESSDEEDDEEEGDEDDSDDAEPRAPVPQRNMGASPNGSTAEIAAPAPQHVRPPRTLPQIPGGRLGVEADEYSQRRPDQYSDVGRRTQYDDAPHFRSQAEAPLPGAARQNVWSQVLDPGRKPDPPAPENSKFVQLEDSAQMTKAFTPHGLLSAGLQDKQDRSAKRQEELARESGASLVNVPNKPPPPQSGLLGAITAHERDRKREGGMGAALTEREREKRMAEERQRKFDEAQRQQLDQMQMYGGSQYGFNPMMANPMMGMNPMMPMMTGGPMSPMMTGQMGFGGYNPQHMFAAQQAAAQAYQQAMMAFSMAGSQVGDGAGQQQQMVNPMMTGGMGAFDPRMTMMGGMPMMGGPMMNPMGMQMTGMSTFDPRFTPPNHTPSPGGELPPAAGGSFNPQFASQGSFSNLPMGNGSPLTRSTGTPDDTRPSSPKA